ncbi:MAG: hypothetical protein M3119_05990 [Verrucomicrobiota bacterium]|nr:hypothetical protein [Verrucomicrobiota bacterium]MDQ6939691.1 hypothetical protein [Verrucomicrobiota bacterium]
MEETSAKWLRVGAGILAANLLGWLVTAGYVWLFSALQSDNNQIAPLLIWTVYPNLLLIPTLMGLAASCFWRPVEKRIWMYLLFSFLTVLICLAGAFLFLREGVICLLIVSPVLLVAIFAGSLIGRTLFKGADNTLRLAMFPLLILFVLVEGKIARQGEGMVTDRITIAAPRAEVWKHVVAFPRIRTEPDYWLNKVGLPSAVETTCEGEFVGARRACIFSNGLVFKEVVAEIETTRLLTFDVTEQPQDPELLGHVTLHRGQFRLEANADGTTTLVGSSWYTLHVRPLWYFGWWTRDITRHAHGRVMQHIKELSEQGP